MDLLLRSGANSQEPYSTVRVTVFGLGYVGCVTAACLAELNHDVLGIDVDETKVSMVNAGRSPIIEPQLEELIQRGVTSGRLRAATELQDPAEIVLVCVGTPSNENGSLGLDQMVRVIREIGEWLQRSSGKLIVVIRSTVLPGTLESTIIPGLERHSGKKCGADFQVCMNPEFMRETTAVADFFNPPFTVVGTNDKQTANSVAELFKTIAAPIHRTTIREAEMVKYACNAFHAVKVCFSNEVGNLSKRLGIDSHRVLEILCADKKLNLSPSYMKPGFAFGGSCLPKDLRAIVYKAKQEDLEMPVIASSLASNSQQIEFAFSMIRKTGKRRIGVLGLSFKSGTDDLRESPIVSLIERLIGKGYKVSVYDEEVSLAKLYGANRRYIEQTIPHISSLMAGSLNDVFDASDVVVISKKTSNFAEAVKTYGCNHNIIDLVRLWPELYDTPNNYDGICW